MGRREAAYRDLLAVQSAVNQRHNYPQIAEVLTPQAKRLGEGRTRRLFHKTTIAGEEMRSAAFAGACPKPGDMWLEDRSAISGDGARPRPGTAACRVGL